MYNIIKLNKESPIYNLSELLWLVAETFALSKAWEHKNGGISLDPDTIWSKTVGGKVWPG